MNYKLRQHPPHHHLLELVPRKAPRKSPRIRWAMREEKALKEVFDEKKEVMDEEEVREANDEKLEDFSRTEIDWRRCSPSFAF